MSYFIKFALLKYTLVLVVVVVLEINVDNVNVGSFYWTSDMRNTVKNVVYTYLDKNKWL